MLTSVLCLSQMSVAQGFARIYRDEKSWLGTSITQTADGGFYVFGHNGSGMGTLDSFVNLIKLDFAGNMQFNRSYVRTDTNYLKGEKMCKAASGGLWLTGISTKTVGSFSYNFVYVIRTDALGNERWSKIYPADSINQPTDISELPNGDIFVSGRDGNRVYDMLGMLLDSLGNLKWKRTFNPGPGFSISNKHLVLPNREILLLGSTDSFPAGANASITKIDTLGRMIWNKSLHLGNGSFLKDGVLTADGNILVVGNAALTGIYSLYIAKYDTAGNLIWYKTATGTGAESITSVVENPDRSIVTLAGNNFSAPTRTMYALTKFSASGDTLWSRAHFLLPLVGLWPQQLIRHNDGGYAYTGFFYDVPLNRYRTRVVKTDSLGNVYSNTLKGYLYADRNTNCVKDAAELVLKNWLIKIYKGVDTFYAYTDTTGYYEVQTDSGSYTLEPSLSPYVRTTSCIGANLIRFPSYYSDSSKNVPVEVSADCPFLQVDMAASRFSVCRPASLTVFYRNDGMRSADSSYILIATDSLLTVDSMSRAFTAISSHLFRVYLGTLLPVSSGSFQVYARYPCDTTVIGRTLCATAAIFPDSFCVAPSPTWDGASLEFSAVCDTSLDSLRFTLRNKGSGAMVLDQTLTIIEDNIMFISSPVNLPSGVSLSVSVPANGSTWRAIISQTNQHPLTTYTTKALEACASPGVRFHPGFINQYPQDDQSPFVAVSCNPIVAAYDPNEKVVVPSGAGIDHITEKNRTLSYTLHCQNTGNDTAFNVYILDTLSANLDLNSIRPGASSHPYVFKMLNPRVAQFYFPEIKLVDSATNEPASKAYVHFTIDQVKDLAEGSEISNRVSIYFDINSPVLTNTVKNKIGSIRILDVKNVPGFESMHLQVYPNPASEQVFVETSEQATQIELYDLRGVLVLSLPCTGNKTNVSLHGLSSGMYVLKVNNRKGIAGTAKIVIP